MFSFAGNMGVCRIASLLLFMAAAVILGGTLPPPSSDRNSRYRSTAASRRARYVEFDPPRIIPRNDFQTVKAGSNYTFRCEGSRGVSWRLPVEAESGLRRRLSVRYQHEDGGSSAAAQKRRGTSPLPYVTELTIRNLVFSDTATFTCTYNGTRDLSSIDNSTKVHLYVEDGQHLLRQTGFDFLQAIQSQTFILPCMPTHPDVNVTLWRHGGNTGKQKVDMDKFISFDPKVGFRVSPVTAQLHSGDFTCEAKYHGVSESYVMSLKVLMETSYVPPPYINMTLARHVRRGGDFSLVCSVTVDFGVMVELSWEPPNKKAVNQGRLFTPPAYATNLSMAGTHLKVVKQVLKVHRSTKDDQGIYYCKVLDHSGNTQTKSEFVRILDEKESYLRIYFEGYQTLEKTVGDTEDVQWVVQIEAHPEPKVEWYGPDGMEITSANTEYTIQTFTGKSARTMLRINRLSLSTSGMFTVKVYNDRHLKTEAFNLIVRSPPTVEGSVVSHQPDSAGSLYSYGEEYTLKCSAKGFPIPDIQWLFKPCSSYTECDNVNIKNLIAPIRESQRNKYWRDSVLKTVAHASGKYICQACNKITCKFDLIPFFISDIEGEGGDFAVHAPDQVLTGESMRLKCSVSSYNFTEDSLKWYKHTLNGLVELTKAGGRHRSYEVNSSRTKLSYSKEIIFSNVTLKDKGRYVCSARSKFANVNRFTMTTRSGPGYKSARDQDYGTMDPEDDSIKDQSVNVMVFPLERPQLVESSLIFPEGEPEVLVVENPKDGLELECKASGRPEPEVKWRLNGVSIKPSKNSSRVRVVDDGRLLRITYVTPEDEGLFECTAINRVGSVKAARLVHLKSTSDRDTLYAKISVPIIVAVIIALGLVGLLVALAKVCYNKSRGKTWKASPTSPTPKLTQYELPQEQDDDDCRMTVTSTTREGSVSTFSNCNGSIVGIRTNSPGNLYGSMLNDSTKNPYVCHCHAHAVPPCQTLLSQCSICDFSCDNYHMGPIGTMTLQRNHMERNNGVCGGGTYELHKSRSVSPRLDSGI